MDWYSPALTSHRLRTVRVGVNMTLAALVVLVLYPYFPDPGEIEPRPYYAILGVAAFGGATVAFLPWEWLLQTRLGVWLFYVWSLVDIILISCAVAVTGGGASQLYVLYTLTSMFFAASYPPGGHLALLLLTAGCYLGTVQIVGGDTSIAVLFVRTAMLGLIIYMTRFLSVELMTQNATLEASGSAMRRQTAELERMRREAEHLATHDSLTGLLNRGAWFAAATTRKPSALAIIDVDHFKSINDRYGHPGGDEVLRVLAKRLARALEPAGIVGRIGGEEFGVIFESDAEVAGRRCAELVASIAAMPVATPYGEISVTVSAGLAAWSPHPHSREASLSQTYEFADQALYEAKRTGRQRLVVYNRPDTRLPEASPPARGLYGATGRTAQPLTADA